MCHIVYEITNLINGKYYIGKHSTDNIDDGYMGSGIAIKRAIDKYGVCNFDRVVIASFDDEDDAITLEKTIVTEDLKSRKTNYNMMVGGVGFNKGHAPWNKGLKTGPFSEERKKALSKSQKGKKKSFRTDEHRMNMSKANKGQIPWNKGKKGVSTETSKSMSDAKKNVSDETRKKYSDAKKGKKRKPFTEATREKMRIAQQKRRSNGGR